MAYREVEMWEILSVLERIGRGESKSAVARLTGLDRKTVRHAAGQPGGRGLLERALPVRRQALRLPGPPPGHRADGGSGAVSPSTPPTARGSRTLSSPATSTRSSSSVTAGAQPSSPRTEPSRSGSRSSMLRSWPRAPSTAWPTTRTRSSSRARAIAAGSDRSSAPAYPRTPRDRRWRTREVRRSHPGKSVRGWGKVAETGGARWRKVTTERLVGDLGFRLLLRKAPSGRDERPGQSQSNPRVISQGVPQTCRNCVKAGSPILSRSAAPVWSCTVCPTAGMMSVRDPGLWTFRPYRSAEPKASLCPKPEAEVGSAVGLLHREVHMHP